MIHSKSFAPSKNLTPAGIERKHVAIAKERKKRVVKKATGGGTSLRNGPPLHRAQLAKNKSVGKRRL
jgi:hypothetical protein